MIKIAAFALALLGCPSGTFGPPPPPDDPVMIVPTDSAAPPPERACTVLLGLGCSEGANAHCAETIRLSPLSNVSAVNVDCVLAATNKQTVRTCGVRCP